MRNTLEVNSQHLLTGRSGADNLTESASLRPSPRLSPMARGVNDEHED